MLGGPAASSNAVLASALALCIRCTYVARGMSELRFEWDPVKEAGNLRKHGVSFEEAQTVFWDERGQLIDDPDHSVGEERFVLLGLSARLRILVVVHYYEKDPDTIGIISARKATRSERARYERGWQP